MYICNPPPPPYLPFCVFSAKKSHTGVLCMYAADMLAIVCTGASEGQN